MTTHNEGCLAICQLDFKTILTACAEFILENIARYLLGEE